ncbi:MAG: hypothetical protein NTU61_00485 [Candidatus Altiarchaeota archaeon]|nr:hypothetical protein [Candidatus Altiarchaeota archaeon]
MADILDEPGKAEVLQRINDYYGSRFSTEHRLLAKKEREGEKIFIYSGSELPTIPAEWIGMHIATISQDAIELSIEGAQTVGATASRNVVEIRREDAEKLMKGLDLEYAGDLRGCVILKHAGKPICTCRADEGMIVNTIPLSRRTERYKKEEKVE